jgi:hypothetical protein
MIVYRIEDSNGYGAFHSLSYAHDDFALQEDVPQAMSHPAPRSDAERGTELAAFYRGGFADDRFRFGCRSKHQLRLWFRSEKGRGAMAQYGGVMVTYYVPDEHVKRGRYQVAFNIDKASRLSSVPANEW